jgi:hypothetical protein
MRSLACDGSIPSGRSSVWPAQEGFNVDVGGMVEGKGKLIGGKGRKSSQHRFACCLRHYRLAHHAFTTQLIKCQKVGICKHV